MPRIALFDLDDTLLDGDCSDLWNQHMIELGWIPDPEAFMAATERMQQEYHQGRLDLARYLTLSLAPLRGRCLEAVRQQVHGFVEQALLGRIFAQAREQIAAHRDAADVVAIVSASSHHLVAPIAAALDIEHALAVELASEDGRYTGHTRGVLSFREGKVSRVEQWRRALALGKAPITFYSDSQNDLPLLYHADVAVAVNPDPVLARVATRQGWKRLDWRAPAADGVSSATPQSAVTP